MDYTALDADLADLTALAARISGAEISLVNLVDCYNQWSVARHGIEITQMKREDSICQYTIQREEALELKGLKSDPRFKDKHYVCGGPELNYYYGVPLKIASGANIGALCILNKRNLDLNKEQAGLLENVAQLVVSRLELVQRTRELQDRLNDANQSKRKVSHDIRGPVSGILGLINLLKEDWNKGEFAKFPELLDMMEQGGEGVLEFTDQILSEPKHSDSDYTCRILADKLKQLYAPLASSKKLDLSIDCGDGFGEPTYFQPKALLQISGNLINNAIKFTPEGGTVSVRIWAEENQEDVSKTLRIEVKDTGSGMPEEKINEILEGRSESELGTEGERGFGLGLPLVRELVTNAQGILEIDSRPGEGCRFAVQIPIQ